MKDRIKKPKVFLSHSKKNEEFMLKIRNDFQRCQIESWVDVFDIRHGKPWLDEIFENGIPTCDCFLVYLTEHSISSPMVKKEMDASLIEQLNDNKVSFLPYVSEEQHREKLRADIRALQVPIWNAENYSDILPVVVSEIWRSFFERLIGIATGEEKRKRLSS